MPTIHTMLSDEPVVVLDYPAACVEWQRALYQYKGEDKWEICAEPGDTVYWAQEKKVQFSFPTDPKEGQRVFILPVAYNLTRQPHQEDMNV